MDTVTEPATTLLWREAVGLELRHARRSHALRIADVASRAGVSAQYLSEIERGRKDPSSEILDALSGALGLPVSSLVHRVAERVESPTLGDVTPLRPATLDAASRTEMVA